MFTSLLHSYLVYEHMSERKNELQKTAQLHQTLYKLHNQTLGVEQNSDWKNDHES